MGRALITPLSDIDLHGTEGVDGEPLVGVDGDTEEARVGVDQLVNITNLGVPQNAGITQVGEVSHVIGAVKLAGVDLANLVLLVDLDLASDLDGDLLAIGGLQHTLEVAAISLVVDPHRLLGVIGLVLVLQLKLVIDQQPWAWVWVGSRCFLDMAGHTV